MSTSLPLPRALVVVALLCLLQGISAVFNIVISALHHQVQLDFGVLDLFVCFGLLRLSDGWRICALVLNYASLILVPIVFTVFVIYVPLGGTTAHIQMFGMGYHAVRPFFVTLMVILWFGLTLWQVSVLKRPDVVALFLRRKFA